MVRESKKTKTSKTGRLKASTLIEVIVASIISLITLIIALDTVTRLTVSQDDGETLVEVDNAINLSVKEFCNGKYENGIYTESYSWGEIKTVVSDYKDYKTVQEMTLNVEIKNSQKKMKVKHIVEITKR